MVQDNIFMEAGKNMCEQFTMAVVAAPKIAMRERTEIWPINVAIASNTNTPYTYGCCKNKKRSIFL